MEDLNTIMKIRTATLNDLDALTAVEAECFPAAEAATKKDFERSVAEWYNKDQSAPADICERAQLLRKQEDS